MGKRDTAVWKQKKIAEEFNVTLHTLKEFHLIKVYNNLESFKSIRNKKDYIYNTDLLKECEVRFRDKLWSNYIKPYRSQTLEIIGDLIEESKRASMCMQTIATY